jgi:hypothetical protein
MTDTLALEKLYQDVQVQFAQDGTTAVQPFGWRVTAQQVVAPRITWQPGDPSGSLGRMDPPRNPGRNPRPLGTLRELFTCTISAQDPGDPENEAAQYKATRLLFDAWYRAVYLAAVGTFTVERTDWIIEKNERRFGTAIRVIGSIQAMIPDAELQGVPVDTRAVIAVSELNVTETQTPIAAAPDGPAASEDPQ